MGEVLSKSSSSLLVELWYKCKADYYRRLHPKPTYPYCKLMSYSVSLAQSRCFHGDPIKQTPNLEAKLKYKDLYNLKLDQLLKWENRIVSLIESRENARSPRKFYVGTKIV